MTTLSGTDFNNTYPNTEFYKVLTTECKHYGFTYQHGLNVDHIPFNPSGECSAGGLYFTEIDKLGCWVDDPDSSEYIAKVSIPSNASVYVEQNKFKADQFVLDLDNKVLMKDFYMWGNEAFCKIAVSQNGCALGYVKDQTDEICKIAVSNNACALKHVINQTDEICKIAISNHACALKHVINQTDELCKLAINHFGQALEYVINQTDELCRLAVSRDGCALLYVINQTDELCKLAISQNGCALQYVKIQTDEIRRLYIRKIVH
jgi:hypothetical protein